MSKFIEGWCRFKKNTISGPTKWCCGGRKVGRGIDCGCLFKQNSLRPKPQRGKGAEATERQRDKVRQKMCPALYPIGAPNKTSPYVK